LYRLGQITYSPVFWTNKNKNIIAAFGFTEDDIITTIYEFDASTLETVGTPFKGHTEHITGLALSFHGALLASASNDNTIKLWDCESRQLLASFDVQNPRILVLSPNSRQLAYTVDTKDDCKICICDTPPEVLAQARVRIFHKHLLFVYQHFLTDECTQKGSSP
jgi:WD40 repeat protein